MKIKKLKNRIISIILSVALLIQPIVVYAADDAMTAEQLGVQSVVSANGERNKIRVTFNQPVRVDETDLLIFATQNSEYLSDEKIYSNSISLVEPYEYNGTQYAVAIDVNFAMDIYSDGYIFITDKIYDGYVTPICDNAGNLLVANNSYNSCDSVMTAYTIENMLSQVLLTSQKSVILKFNCDAQFLGNACEYIFAQDSLKTKTIYANSVQKTDVGTFKVEFSEVLPEMGSIIISEAQADADDYMNSVLSVLAPKGIKSNNPSEIQGDSIVFTYQNNFLYAQNIQFLELNTVRVTFSQPISFKN